MAPRLFAAILLATAALSAQPRNPVQWTLTLDPASAPPGSTVHATFQAKIESGWHIYALSNPPGGPTPTTIKVNPANPAIAAR
ncbi:MAG: redoxin, partial [Bryobacteraceae bacterium]|nr:redoxin [Bryobacteraceae bacterium]